MPPKNPRRTGMKTWTRWALVLVTTVVAAAGAAVGTVNTPAAVGTVNTPAAVGSVGTLAVIDGAIPSAAVGTFSMVAAVGGFDALASARCDPAGGLQLQTLA